MTTALSPAPAVGPVPTAPTAGTAPAPADDPARAPGVGGPSLAAARPDPADSDPRRALHELECWRADGRDAARFPYGAVLGHYRTVGKNAVGAELLTVLRAVEPAVPAPAETAGPAARLLTDWLPQVVDGTQGDYDSYLGSPVYASLARTGAGTEQVITALLADLVATEAATLPEAPAGRARTRAALRALTAAAGLLYRVRSEGRAPDHPGRHGRPGPGLRRGGRGGAGGGAVRGGAGGGADADADHPVPRRADVHPGHPDLRGRLRRRRPLHRGRHRGGGHAAGPTGRGNCWRARPGR